MKLNERINILPEEINIEESLKDKLVRDYEVFASEGPPENFEAYILDEYRVDLAAEYAGIKIKNPFGKASGQLSCKSTQVESDAEAGIGFVVLKTVISQDKSMNSKMDEWKVKAPKMVVEDIISKSGKKGYTVSWKGRGWDESFENYLKLTEEALKIGLKHNMMVIPSCKYHLPVNGEEYNELEYEYTTKELLNCWHKVMGKAPMVLEKDFSPTLSGSEKSKNKKDILDWIINVPSKIKKYASEGELILGLKLMNAMFEDEYQVEMVKTALSDESHCDFLIVFNRLFSAEKEFEGKRGIAYGGWDLSDRNLKVLSMLRDAQYKGYISIDDKPLSATGNIESGRTMVEYGLRGCSTGQLHTYFQIPSDNYKMISGSRSLRAIHELIFNPQNGLIAVMLYLRDKKGVNSHNGIIKWEDIYTLYKKQNIFQL